MNKKDKILFFCMIFVQMAALGQKDLPEKRNLLLSEVYSNAVLQGIPKIKILKYNEHSVLFLPASYYSSNLGFFCKQELKLDKVSKIPFRFRLGSIEQCDMLEGKRKR